jgi:hypothetical protein
MEEFMKNRSFLAITLVMLLLMAGTVPISVDAACVTPPSGLVSWWGGDNNTLDIVGTNNGTLQGTATYTAGKVGQAFSMDGGQNNYVEIPDSSSLNPTGVFTAGGWFYIDPAVNAGKIATLVAKTEGSLYNGWALYFDDRGSTKSLKFVLGAITEVQNAIPSAGWYHIAGVYDPQASPQARIYINGASAGSANSTGAVTNSLNVRIGAMYWTDNYGIGNDRLNGRADEVMLFNRALSASEIASIYNADSEGICRPSVAPPAGLTSWWKGESNANDQLGLNNATLQGGATFTTGKVGQAFSFDGVNDYVLIGDPIPASLKFQNEITLEAWVYITEYAPGMGLIVGSQYDTNHAGASLILNCQDSPIGSIYFDIGDGSWHNTVTSTLLPLNQWVHIVATRKANEDGKVYFNGVLQPSTSQAWSGSISYSGAWYAIGQQKDQNRPFKGLIDEVRVYSRALSANEISAIYNAGSSGMTPIDITPDPFSFVVQTGMPLNTTIVSNPITVTGINTPASISITACTAIPCEYKVNSGSWTAGDGNVSNGDIVLFRQTSSANPLTATAATLTIGGVSGAFNVTTAALSDPNATELVSWWKAENNAYDSIGGNHGTLFNGTTFGSGDIGQAFSFDGVDDYISVPNNPPPGSLAISAWIKSSDNSQNRLIIGENVGVQGTGWQFFIQAGGGLVFGIYNGSWTFVTSSVALPVNQWVHVAVTFDTTNGAMQLYINGVPDATSQYTGGLWAANTNPLKIGSLGTPSGAAPFDGLIDEVKIYSRALSASEIANTYGLVAWWKGENDAFDSVGGNNGVWNGTPAYASGKIGQAFSFDGVDDTVSVGMLNNAALNETLPFSMAAWINTSDTSPYQTIASNYMGDSGGTGDYSTYLIINSGELVFGLNKRQLADNSISTGISTGWHFVTATYDGSVLSLYLDGVLKNSTVRDFSGSSDNTRGWYIGNYPPEWVAKWYNTSFHGLIDDVKIYSRALSAAEVAYSYGLISWWRGDGNALDSIGGNHGTLVNGATFAAGHDGQAFSFNGSQYAQITAPVNLPVGNAPRSVSLWLKTPLDLSVGTEAGIFQYGTASDGHMFGLVVSNFAPGKLYFYGHSADLNGTTTMLPNNWYHAVVTYDGATVTLYLNGNPEASAARSLDTILDGNGLTIGHQIGKASTWLGEIDEVQVFNRALSAMEVSELAGTYPDAFSFTPVPDAQPSTPVTSNEITVTGISQPAPVSISGGAKYAVSTNGGLLWGSCTSTSGTVNVNNQVKVCLTSSSSYSTTTTATLNIGGREGTFSVTTKADIEKPVVTGFSIAATEPTTNMGIGVTLFNATDNDSVSGYLITTSGTPPSSSDLDWSASAPTTFNIPTAGINTLYAWAKDRSGNVSEPLSSLPHVTLQPVLRDPATYYTSLQTACGAANTGETIKALSVTVQENVTITGKTLTIKGGHADGYGSQPGITTIQGTLTIGTGSLTVDRVTVR